MALISPTVLKRRMDHQQGVATADAITVIQPSLSVAVRVCINHVVDSIDKPFYY
jgi:hypothetical protein